MVELIEKVLPYIPASTIPVILVVLGGIYIYKKIDSERKVTKELRDKDSLEVHDTLMKHSFQITQLKDQQALISTVVDDLRDTCSQLNTNIVKLDTNVQNLTEVVRELKKHD